MTSIVSLRNQLAMAPSPSSPVRSRYCEAIWKDFFEQLRERDSHGRKTICCRLRSRSPHRSADDAEIRPPELSYEDEAGRWPAELWKPDASSAEGCREPANVFCRLLSASVRAGYYGVSSPHDRRNLAGYFARQHPERAVSRCQVPAGLTMHVNRPRRCQTGLRTSGEETGRNLPGCLPIRTWPDRSSHFEKAKLRHFPQRRRFRRPSSPRRPDNAAAARRAAFKGALSTSSR